MADEHNSAHVISLFRFRMRDLTPAQREEYSSTLEQLLTLASAMPGFISFRHYTSDDGETFAVVEFASAEALAAWRDHLDHRKAQHRGRNELYSEYEIINCAVMHRYGYKP
jgi:heme-degrading monooxygenase HmoA